MGDRTQELEVEEIVYEPHPVSGGNEGSEVLVGAGEMTGQKKP